MTATPTAGSTFEQKYGDFVRKAGSKFGFDLAGLFDDEAEGTTSLDGFAPSFSMKTMYKGRSPSTLTYKAPKNPARIAEFSLTPEGVGSTAGTVTSAVGMPTVVKEEKAATPEKANRLLSSFIGELGDPSKGTLGALGLGRALEYGYTPEQVLAKAKQEGIGFGEEAAKTLGLSELTQYQGQLAEGKTIGLEALDRARASGLSDELIKNLAKQQGVGFGEKAAAQLGTPKVTDLNQYIGSAASGATPGTLGLEAVGRAKAAGLSDTQIRDLASQQGLSFGAGAASRLGVQSASQRASSGGGSSSSTNLSSFIGSTGNQGTLGLEAVNRARSSGLSDSQIRQMASSQGLGLGAAARSALGL
jgi:hypothetical protein